MRPLQDATPLLQEAEVAALQDEVVEPAELVQRGLSWVAGLRLASHSSFAPWPAELARPVRPHPR